MGNTILSDKFLKESIDYYNELRSLESNSKLFID